MSESPTVYATIFLGAEGWRLGIVRDGEAVVAAVETQGDPTPAARAGAVADRLRESGRRVGAVVIAVDSPLCLCATIGTADLERTGRRKAMAFRLEEHLPIAAEDAVADFVETGPGRALGICAAVADLKPVVDALEDVGVRVGRIAPTAVLAAAHARRCYDAPDAMLLVDDPADDEATGECGVDLIEFGDGGLAQWWWYADDADAAVERLGALAGDRGAALRLGVVGSSRLLTPPVLAMNDFELMDSLDRDADEAATLEACLVARGLEGPWVDLRRDGLAPPDPMEAYRRPAMAMAAALALLLVGLIVVGQWRAARYDAIADGLVIEQAAVFRDAVPGELPPRDIRGRLDSERRKLAGLGGHAVEDGGATSLRQVSALTQLHRVLSALPTNVRFRLLDVSIGPREVRLVGEAQSFGDAERLVIALRQTGRYDVDQPETRALPERGVGFSFSARPAANPPAEPQALQQQAESELDPGDRT